MYQIKDYSYSKAKELEEKGKEYADVRRTLYKIRHNKDRKITGSAGFYADKILW